MGTYIIHFDDKPWEDLDDELYYRCSEIPWFSTTKTTISRLIPYTEDSAYAHGYTEAESKYREIRDELEKQAHQRGYKEAYDTAYADAEEIYESGKRVMYQKGLKDAWEAARWLSKTNAGENFKIFGMHFTSEIVQKISASECIEKIKQYEQEKKEEQIQVGDEVNAPFGKAIVVNIDSVAEKIWLVYADGHGGFEYFKDAPTKTGRHFPEIAKVLQKMKETDNG